MERWVRACDPRRALVLLAFAFALGIGVAGWELQAGSPELSSLIRIDR
jgi:hypothetical protein